MISMPESRIANRGMTAACPVILRSPTRQSLRRSGYGSPAKAESRYGDGASEATKDLRFLLARKTEILHFAQDDREGMVQAVNRQSPIVNRS
jgi:hypothetical protein